MLHDYVVLNSGSALGKGVGPLLISKNNFDSSQVADAIIAIPGENTTAHLLFSLAYPAATKKIFMRYDAIENFVSECKGLGVIIHENRFTYKEKGLIKITDLGDYWETTTGSAIPLGGIVIKRNIDIAIQQKIDQLIKRSIEYAFSNYPALNEYIHSHSQEMSEDVMRKHIDLYVNDYSLNLGKTGKNAIITLLKAHPSFNKRMVTEKIFLKD